MIDEPRSPRQLIAGAADLIVELQEFKISADPSHPINPEICRRAAATLEQFAALEKIVREGRHAFSGMNREGATILDFFNVWLDQERAENAKLRQLAGEKP